MLYQSTRFDLVLRQTRKGDLGLQRKVAAQRWTFSRKGVNRTKLALRRGGFAIVRFTVYRRVDIPRVDRVRRVFKSCPAQYHIEL